MNRRENRINPAIPFTRTIPATCPTILVRDMRTTESKSLITPMPGWWKMGFWATIWFSVIYIPLNYSPMIDGSIHAIYEREKVANIKLQFAEIGELTADGKSVARFINKPSWLSVGQAVYKANCVQCHGPDAYGLIGPNLADEAYKHIKNLDDIVDVLANGRANGSMPAWKNRMSVNELVMVSAYVASLRGTADGQGKAPEGRLIDPWPEPPVEKEKPVDEPAVDSAWTSRYTLAASRLRN